MKFPFSKVRGLRGALLGVAAGVAAGVIPAAPAHALDYRSVDSATVLYDAPSAKGKKLFVVRRLTPVEVVVTTGDWVKVRDAEGSLAWIEKKALADKRTVIVIAPRAAVREKADPTAPVLFEAEKWVALDLVEARKDGWVQVRHADGASGFVRVNQVWGL
jgi:SH3-like domain-containing protein